MLKVCISGIKYTVTLADIVIIRLAALGCYNKSFLNKVYLKKCFFYKLTLGTFMHRVWNEAFPGGIDMSTTQSRNCLGVFNMNKINHARPALCPKQLYPPRAEGLQQPFSRNC